MLYLLSEEKKSVKTFVVRVSPFHERNVSDEEKLNEVDIDPPEEDLVVAEATVGDNDDEENEDEDLIN